MQELSKEAVLTTVTPAKAEAWLNKNTGNRALREGYAEGLAADMKAGRWTQCVAPIAFYDDGTIADGQHRLFAVVESQTPQKFWVIQGLPRPAGLNIDRGAPRTLVDNARISGADDGLSNALVGLCRSIWRKKNQFKRGLTDSERLAIVAKHRDAAGWTLHFGPRGRYLRTGPVMAAVAKAWYCVQDKERLHQFCTVLTNGHGNGQEDSAAISFRNYMISAGANASQSTQWWDTQLKCQNAISYFIRRKPLMVIKGVSEETYPLKKA